MAFHLCVDIGNSRTKFGLFENDELMQVKALANEELAQNNQLFNDYPIQGLIISSVNENAALDLSIPEHVPIHFLSEKSKLPFNNKYQSPETLGKDRIALMAGGMKLYKNDDVLAIDAGTCITYDFLTSENHYLGGAISPGVQMRLKAMNQQTDQLPLLNWLDGNRPKTTGNTTMASMLSGVINGVINEMNGFISSYQEQYPRLKIVITGGDAQFFEKELKNSIFANPNLVLIGLHEILKHNLH